jgi:serine protease inhibitor ecotin
MIRQTAENARLSDKQDLAINIEAATLNGWWRDYCLINRFSLEHPYSIILITLGY